MGNDLADAVEALDHTVDLGMPEPTEAVLDAKLSVDEVKGVLARGLLVGTGESIRELAAVVGQHLLNHHGCSAFESPQEVCAAGLGLVAINAKVDPSRRTIDSDEQVAPVGLVGHLRKVLDIAPGS